MKEILIPVDNSKHSSYCIDVGLSIATKFNSKLVGNHIYAAKLHDDRFAQMESGLPEKYQEPVELEKQRDIHDSLITQGLELISNSFLDYFEQKCNKSDIPFGRKIMEGKNYKQIVKDIDTGDYSLVIMGALGLGALHRTTVGSVTSRVVRRSKTNVLVVRRPEKWDRKIIVAVDGSPHSFAAVKTCSAFAKSYGVPMEAIGVFDPDYHITAFRSIAGVLSDEAGKIFRFKEQEKLHDEIIDKGLEKIYQGHLDTAKKIAKDEGVDIETFLFSGRSIEKILEYVDKEDPSLMAVGKIGVHSDNGLDLGSISENLLMNLKCNMLVVSDTFQPQVDEDASDKTPQIPWRPDALARMARIPDFVRNMAKSAIVDHALSKGYKEITAEVVSEARKKMGM